MSARFRILAPFLIGLFLVRLPAAGAEATVSAGPERLDLTLARVVIAPGMSGPEKKAAQMLVEETRRRSRVLWPVGEERGTATGPVIFLGQRAALVQAFPELAAHVAGPGASQAEGYRLVTTSTGIVIAGNDPRGVLYGAGRLLRLMDYGRGAVSVESGLGLETAPVYRLRGHQLGYRPKTNSYDGWDVAQWEAYIRELVIFGANAIEGMPPRTDDAAESPHFPLPAIEMLAHQSRIARDYGIDFWLWYPALDENYGDPATVEAALREWGDVIRRLPRVDAVFVPGGDPGHTPPKLLFPMVARQAEQLQRLHPGAKVWISPQGFRGEWMRDFHALLHEGQPWLEGIVYAPQQSERIEEFRARIPTRYKLRLYPDITHALACQYPVPDWDFALASTLHREPIMPRPLDQAAIFRRVQPVAEHGFLTYSEGCTDDVNKFIWSALGWDPGADVGGILRDYGRFFIGSAEGEGFAQGLLALERNWRGRLLANDGVYTTLAQFQAMERSGRPEVLANWRFQSALYRAYYDATIRARLIAETAQQDAVLAALRRARETGTAAALDAAEALLRAPKERPGEDWRARVFTLAEGLFQSVRLQLSVPRYQAIGIRRGANLDLIDFPVSDLPWLRAQAAEIRNLSSEPERLARIDAIVNWTNPGPGGFYDDLGNITAQPHLLRGDLSYDEDPAGQRSPLMHIAPRHGGASSRIQGPAVARVSSSTFAEALHDQPLEMLYRGLDPRARYRLRVVYGSEVASRIRLVADGVHEIHPMQDKDLEVRPLEFPIPAEATRDGELRLTWTRPPGLGGTGRGVQVAEVWLIRVP
jgi:hypothetical protein